MVFSVRVPLEMLIDPLKARLEYPFFSSSDIWLLLELTKESCYVFTDRLIKEREWHSLGLHEWQSRESAPPSKSSHTLVRISHLLEFDLPRLGRRQGRKDRSRKC